MMENEGKISRETFDEVMVPNYSPLNIIPVSGKGVYVRDQNDREYIDFTAGIAVSVLGHCHPDLIRTLENQGGKLWHLSNVFTNEPALELAKVLVHRTFAEKVFFCNSGTEANEAAFKLARKYAFDHFSSEKNEIIAFDQAFHGRSLFTVSVGGQPKYRQGFEPVPGGICHVPFNDLEALEKVISDRTCAVVLEPVQGEGGVIPADAEFIHGIRRLCNQYDALMIMDEVQTGVGRTGSLYAYMQFDVVPDILTTAKGLGGGFPVGAMLTTTKIANSLGFGTHGSTYGGNPLACAVAKEVLSHIDDSLLHSVRKNHDLFVGLLDNMNRKYNIFQEIRGMGLLMGCALNEKWKGKAKQFVQAALGEGLMLLVAGPDTLRIAPPLIISEKEIRQGMERFDAAVSNVLSCE